MKYLIIISFSIIAVCWSCKLNKKVDLDYCNMLEKDQSHMNEGVTDPDKRKENTSLRNKGFEENFQQILELTKQQGFPNVSFEDLPKDSCKYWAVTATLIHMAQTKPEVFFSEEITTLFKEEINKGNLDSDDLTPAYRISFTSNKFCQNLEASINHAIQTLGMETYLNGSPTFKKCE
ncbi:MAG TPA: hypothetical protein PKD51_00745 [Saprospiraceae bacterium]|nr:hypothetical protein [Saprospiraceae bacterium]